EGVQVAGARVRWLALRVDEQVVGILIEQIDVERLGVCRTAALRRARNRIVVVERRSRRRDDGDRADASQQDEQRKLSSHHHSQNTCEAEKFSTTPSFPFASSMRSGVVIGPWNRKPIP